MLAKWETKKPHGPNQKSPKSNEDVDWKSMFILKKRIFQSSCRQFEDLAAMTTKSIKQLYYQCLNDYINIGVLDLMPRYEDVGKMAAYIIYFKYRSNILKSKDGELTKDMVSKFFTKAIPSAVREESNLDQWYSQISAFYNKENIKDLDSEECMRSFLGIYGKYEIAMSSYFFCQKGDATTALRFPAKTFCAVNMTGIYFLQEIGRREIITKMKYDDIIYVAGYKTDFRIALKDPNFAQNVIQLRLKVKRAREMAEDILTYGQVNLFEKRVCSWVQTIEIKKHIHKQKETSDNATSDAKSEIKSRLKGGLKSVINLAGDNLQQDEEKKDTTIMTKADLEKYFATGIKHYELKKGFLMYEQAFPLNILSDVTGLYKRNEEFQINNFNQPIPEDPKEEEEKSAKFNRTIGQENNEQIGNPKPEANLSYTKIGISAIGKPNMSLEGSNTSMDEDGKK